MNNLYIPLLLANYLANDFFSSGFDSIRCDQKLQMLRRARAATRHLIQMSHFFTTSDGSYKTSRDIKFQKKKQENIFLSQTCYYVKFV